MHDTLTLLRWIASISGTIAAFMVSLDLGRQVTGWGFVVFIGSAFAWIASAVIAGDWPLGIQSAILVGIYVLGVYRYLWRKNRR